MIEIGIPCRPHSEGVFPIIRFLKKIIRRTRKKHPPEAIQRAKDGNPSSLPRVIGRANHTISRANISKNALHVLYRLHEANYEAYLVGGSVRDLLLDGKPKDFDIATNASPEKVRQLFRNSRLIGRRFKLVHVFFGREIIEVATFRASHPTQDHPDARLSDNGLLLRDNIYGSLMEDAWRRDFSVNALYYNIADFSVVDYTGGMVDLKNRTIRMLGDPQLRYREDPVRILRAIRFAAKLGFSIDNETQALIPSMKALLSLVPAARLFEEVLKLFYCGQASLAFNLICEYGVFELLFPETQLVLTGHAQKADYLRLILLSCQNTDERLQHNLSLNPAFLFAVLLWPTLDAQIQQHMSQGKKAYAAFEKSSQQVIAQQIKTIAIPKRYTAIIRELWAMQRIMEKRVHGRVDWVIAHPRFRAAYDFLVLRLQAGESSLAPLVDKWTTLQAASTELTPTPDKRPTRRRKKRKPTPVSE